MNDQTCHKWFVKFQDRFLAGHAHELKLLPKTLYLSDHPLMNTSDHVFPIISVINNFTQFFLSNNSNVVYELIEDNSCRSTSLSFPIVWIPCYKLLFTSPAMAVKPYLPFICFIYVARL